MTERWVESSLGEVLTFQRGFDITKSQQREGPYQVFSSSGPNSTHLAFKANGPGVIVGRKGTLGTVFYSERDFWPHDTTLWVRDFHGNDPRYSYYLVINMRLERYDCGASNPTLNRNHIHQLPVRVPPLQIQKRIANILSRYDDMIENNTRRIKILEQMAQMLYREWFVNFRFPGYEKVKMADSQTGLIPEDWTVEPIANVAEILGGGTPATGAPEYWENGNIDWYSPSDLTAASSMFMFESTKKITELGLTKSSARLFPANSVMMTSRATIGVVSINRTSASTNQGFITCVAGNRMSHFYVYFWLLENKDKITNLATGATFKEINKRTFRELPIIVPSATILLRFQQIVSPICDLVENLLRRNRILRMTRDLLLPKLVSRELSVKTIQSEAAAQPV